MPWPSWQQAAWATVVLVAVAFAIERGGAARARTVAAFLRETALISFLYMIWRLAKQLPLVQEDGAYDRGRWIYRTQRSLHLPSELSMEHFAQAHSWLAHLTVYYYGTLHVPALLCFLAWLWIRHRDHYSRWRNVLAITTGFCLFIRFVRVAPPRLLPEYGFVDLPAKLGMDIYGPVGTGASDQFAAMPSIHVAWAAIVGFGVWSASKSRWRAIGPAHFILTFWAVMATANHWWFDGLAAVGLIGISLAIDAGARRALRRTSADAVLDPAVGVAGEPATV